MKKNKEKKGKKKVGRKKKGGGGKRINEHSFGHNLTCLVVVWGHASAGGDVMEVVVGGSV